ncbi:hypothetical protein B0A48_14794 [Cryoendolithus antarcticus]|uniref:SUI1 domain-containing protein n=1 Tax=Cryoendolithus antarcticus TaxID=1507870 RepID=A0A1V8SKI6_9PEZI|nr:hypothetical protein B0A48_14794 [Cryoendolithus antarcticus]
MRGLKSASGSPPQQIDISDPRFAKTHPSALLYRDATASNLITITPLETYAGTAAPDRSTIRIGNGGAGYTGIFRTLAEAYLSQMPGSDHRLNIAWISNHSRHSLVALLGGFVDIALTYEPDNEDLAIREGWAGRVGRVFNDHFVIAGPVADHAGLAPSQSNEPGESKLKAALQRLAHAGQAGKAIWHSRGDGSATFTKERELFAAAGVDGVTNNAAWLHMHPLTPYAALQRANTDGAYLLTDRATFLTAQQHDVIGGLRVLVEGGQQLLNPCAAMVRSDVSAETVRFAAWLCGDKARNIVKVYGKNWARRKALFTVPEQEDFADEERLASVRCNITVSIMFKKKPTIKPLSPLRSSDRRKLADQIIADFDLAPLSADDSDSAEKRAEATVARTSLRSSLLPDNVQSARFTTTHGPELKQISGTIYVGSQDGTDSRILWWQIDGRMYPSIYTLWNHPGIVPLLHTPEIVVKKLRGGADLMTPGLARGPPFPKKARKGAVVGVASLERPSVPVSVGVCEIDVSALEQVQGAKGHAMETLHWAGDELWSYSTGARPGQEPPEAIEGWQRATDGDELSVGGLIIDEEDDDEGGGVPVESSAATGNGAPLEFKTPAEGNAQDEDPDEPELSQKEIDEAFRNAFLCSIHQQKTSHPHEANHGLVYPLTQSSVVSSLINPFLPAHTQRQSQQLQIKKTSWKNIRKFLKALDKEKLIKTKEKDGNETTITDVDFNDPALASFKPYRLPKKDTGSFAQAEQATVTSSGGDDAVGQKIEIRTLLKPTRELQPLFASAPQPYYTTAEIGSAVTAYVTAESLVSATNKRLVTLNPTLANAVFDGSGSLDKEVLAKGSVPRDALINRVSKAMSSSYTIVRNGVEAKAKSGKPPKVQITLETRSGNKTVTKVSGLETYFVNPRLLADELRKTCAGATSVEALAGAAKKTEKAVEEVMVQGPQKDAVLKALEKRGVKSAWVEVNDKVKKKGGR